MAKILADLLLSVTIFLSLAVCIYPQARWMSDNSTILGKKQLNQIALPGAHDAGTFAISSTAGSTIGSGDGLASPDNKNVKRILSLGPVFGDWAKTQERTTTEMLTDGIRYFDLRVCVDGKGVLMTCHGLFGAPLASMLADIKKFSDQNPREVILLGFNHFWDRAYQIQQNKKQGEIEGLTNENWSQLVTLIKTQLKDSLVSGSAFSPKSKLSDLWQLKTGNRIIVLFDTEEGPEDDLIWKNREENTWVGGWDLAAFKAGTLKVLQNAAEKKYADKFYAIRSSVTPDDGGRLISMGIISDIYPSSVSELADMTNPVALGWVKNEWAAKYPINLIWADFYNRHDLVKLAKRINGIKVDLRNSKIGTATKWTKWKKKDGEQKSIFDILN